MRFPGEALFKRGESGYHRVMSLPKPGSRVRGSTTGTPMNALFDLLGRRWALGIVWSLGDGPSTFRDLQERCGGVSPSILNSRLKELKEADIIERTLDGYRLTHRGRELREIIVPIGKWAIAWSDEVFQFKKPGAEFVLNDRFRADAPDAAGTEKGL